MDIKDSTCREHWVLFVSDESINSAPANNFTLHIN